MASFLLQFTIAEALVVITKMPAVFAILVCKYDRDGAYFRLAEMGACLPAKAQKHFFAQLNALCKEEFEVLQHFLDMLHQSRPHQTGDYPAKQWFGPFQTRDVSYMSEEEKEQLSKWNVYSSNCKFKGNIGPDIKIFPEGNHFIIMADWIQGWRSDDTKKYILLESGNVCDVVMRSTLANTFADRGDALLTRLAVGGSFHGKAWKKSDTNIPELGIKEFMYMLLLFLRTTPLDR